LYRRSVECRGHQWRWPARRPPVRRIHRRQYHPVQSWSGRSPHATGREPGRDRPGDQSDADVPL